MEAWAIVVAAGRGSRFGAPKQYATLAGRPVLAWSIESGRRTCRGVVLVLPEPDVPAAGSAGWDADVVVAGGPTRSASVRAGLAAVPPTADVIAVHDGARPLASPALWQAVIGAVVEGADGAVPTTAVTDTIKSVGPDDRLTTLDRSSLVAVGTPQAFRAVVLRRAYDLAGDATDDASLVEACGGRVVGVPGAADNLKITTAADLRMAEALLADTRRC